MESYRIDYYQRLREHIPDILADADRLAAELAIPTERRGSIGISGANSSCPARLNDKVVKAIAQASARTVPLSRLGDELRRLIKSVYGDAYDAALAANSEAGLWVSFNALITPPLMGHGEPYRVRYIVPYERHIEHHGSYGRPVPARHKDIFADRGATAGELGLLGRRQELLDTVIVKLPGARYEVHGIKSYVCPLLLEVDAEAAAAAIRRAAERQGPWLGGFASLAYDTPGYGYGTRDMDGAPLLQRRIGQIAQDHGLPYIADNASGMPILGTDIRKIGADIMIFSMDKLAGGPCAGLIVGREEAMVGVRRALGIHSERFGTLSAHGKGGFVAADPGKEALAGTIAALHLLRDAPEIITKPIDLLFDIVRDVYSAYADQIGGGIEITQSVNAGGVEVNYQRTWDGGAFGIPIFSHEDRIAGSNVLNAIINRLGVMPSVADDASTVITPGIGTLTGEGRLIEEAARDVARALFASLALLKRWGERIMRAR
jgi:hypothetical protein